MKAVALEALEKTFADGTRAVRGIDLAIEAGEFIVLLGPSGCGKTTTLRMIAGLERPSSGRISIDGADVTSARPARRDVGFVFQFYALYPHLSARENIEFPLRCLGIGRGERRERVTRVAGRLGLEPLLERLPRQLSGGDQQRVALARAMVRRPSVWLMDEPLGMLDSDRRAEMCEFLRVQQLEQRVTTVYVTHDQEEAMRLADRIVVMSRGEILQADTPARVYDEPADLFVAGFVGSPGMNLVRGEVRAAGGGALAFHPQPPPAFRPQPPPTRGEVPGGTGVGAGGFVLRPENPPGPGRGLPSGPVVLGLRPEDLRLDPTGPIRGQVLAEEYLGSSRCLHVASELGRLVVRCAPDSTARSGDGVALAPDPAHVRLFDPSSGKRIA